MQSVESASPVRPCPTRTRGSRASPARRAGRPFAGSRAEALAEAGHRWAFDSVFVRGVRLQPDLNTKNVRGRMAR